MATGFVCFLGVIFCGFVILAFANNPQKPVALLAGGFLGLAIVLWVLREKPKQSVEEHERKWFGIFTKPKPMQNIRLTRRRKPKIVAFGTNQPPTAERIREIKELTDGMKNWTPPATDPHHENDS